MMIIEIIESTESFGKILKTNMRKVNSIFGFESLVNSDRT